MNTLIIKNISPKLSYSDREELFIHFGAQSVTNLPNYSFALFKNEFESNEAIKRMHQLLVFGQRLRVEFAINQNNIPLNQLPIINEPHIKEKINKQSIESLKEEKMREFLNQMNYISPSLGLNYLSSPLLKYSYPLATLKIVNNIAHVLLSHPRFYTQVLHLMNKMNIRPPFDYDINTQNIIHFLNNYGSNHSNCVQESESELESSDHEDYVQKPSLQKVKPLKRVIKKLKVGFVGEKAVNKRRKLESKVRDKSDNKVTKETKHISNEDIFDVSTVSQKPNIEINIVSDISKLNELSNNCDKESNIERTGFGLIEANKKKNSQTFNEKPVWDKNDIITDEELISNRLSSNEFDNYSVFKGYDAGMPSIRLYVKNIAKQVETKDLMRIFGKYIDWDSETHQNMFDIRLMKSGRMKGQAFITLPDENIAQKALKETNGYLLKEKPIVVVFARSARPKHTI